MNRRKKSKRKTARRASKTPANSPPAGPQSAGDPVEESLERGRQAREALRQAREPSPEDVARKVGYDAFAKKLHERVMEDLDRPAGGGIESLLATADAIKKQVDSLSRKVKGRPASTDNQKTPTSQRTERGIAGGAEKQTQTPAPSEPFTHSEDYRTVVVRGETYTLTPQQARMIQILHGAHKNGTPDLGIHTILENLGTPNSRWQDTWKTNKKAQNALIQKGACKGTLRLNLWLH